LRNYFYKKPIPLTCFFRKSTATDEEVEQYISEEVWRTALSTNIEATDKDEFFKDEKAISSVAKFVRRAFVIHLQAQEKVFLKVKGLDYLTLDIKVPTPKNLVNELNVRDLLKFARKNGRYQYIQLEENQDE